MIDVITPQRVRIELKAKREIAFLDLREEALFAQGHPLFAAQLALGRIELEILDRVPRQDTLVVLYDDGDGLVERGVATLQKLGYSNLRVLAGGLKGWSEARFELFQDVNSYSKAFGELVEHHRRTPSLSAQEVEALLDGGREVAILDARPFDEYSVMNIPTSVNVPGGELVLRARELAPDPETPIIVNCAGRTRSLIGAQSLINAGVPNPVVALRNGTIGWTLAGQKLEQGQSRTFKPGPPGSLEEARAGASQVSYRCGVRTLDLCEARTLAEDVGRTLYNFDVRSAAEYAEGHIPGFRNAPGGQLVQEVDVYAPVRGARIVVFDHLSVRADMTASWLAQLGWEAYVLDAPISACTEAGPWRPRLPDLPSAPTITAANLALRIEADDVTVVDFATSREHRRGHVPGAWFAIRARLREALDPLPEGRTLVFLSPDGSLAQLAAADAAALTSATVLVLSGGTKEWIETGRPLEPELLRMASPPEDVYRRPYEGTEHSQAAMQAYLDWEFGLVEQLRRDGTHGFFVI